MSRSGSLPIVGSFLEIRISGMAMRLAWREWLWVIEVGSQLGHARKMLTA